MCLEKRKGELYLWEKEGGPLIDSKKRQNKSGHRVFGGKKKYVRTSNEKRGEGKGKGFDKKGKKRGGGVEAGKFLTMGGRRWRITSCMEKGLKKGKNSQFTFPKKRIHLISEFGGR